MLIFVFLCFVSCHLDSLTIVSLPHILQLQLGDSAERNRHGQAEDRKQQGGKSEKHRRHTTGSGCQRQAERENDKRGEREEWIKEP